MILGTFDIIFIVAMSFFHLKYHIIGVFMPVCHIFKTCTVLIGIDTKQQKIMNRNLIPITKRTQDLNRFLNSVLGDFNGIFEDIVAPNSLGKTNVSETETSYKVELLMPGVDKSKIDISLENGVLNISYSDKQETEVKETSYVHREWSYSEFNRSFQLPENVDSANIDAAYENGILTLSIAKKQTAPTLLNKIEVK